MKEQQKIFWDAMIEDNADPKGLGRCRIRIMGVHHPDDAIQPVEDLPWAPIALPACFGSNSGTGISSVPEPGSWVQVFFLDGETKQNPVIAWSLAPIHTVGGGGNGGMGNSVSPLGSGDVSEDINVEVGPVQPGDIIKCGHAHADLIAFANGAGRGLNVPPAILLAQLINESGWNSKSSHNYGNIGPGKRYDSLQAAVNDYVSHVKRNCAGAVGIKDPQQYYVKLQTEWKNGSAKMYCTDPPGMEYVNRILKVLKSSILTRVKYAT